MRMWNIDPEILCTKHLLGEHVEMHMFVGCINKGTSLKGYINKNLVEIHNIIQRHDVLAQEMLKRKMKHNSPLPNFEIWKEGKISYDNNLINLLNRCEYCKGRFYKMYGKNEGEIFRK